jgi:probable addiction module antidote protein
MPCPIGEFTRSARPVSENRFDYKADLLARLKELPYAQLYLEAAAKESQGTFLLALRDVAEAQKGMSQLAVEANVNRENLYRALSEEGNPTYSTLSSVLDAFGMELLPSLKHPEPSSPPEPTPREINESGSVQINFNTGNTLQSAGLSFSNNTLLVCMTPSSQDEQDAAGMADVPPAYMLADRTGDNLQQEQLAVGSLING